MIITREFQTTAEANYFVQGAIFGGADPAKSFAGLVGSTVTFTTPAAACTFTQPAGATSIAGLLTFADVKAQMEAAITGLKVLAFGKKIVFVQGTPAAGVALAAVAEPGRLALGLPNNEAVAGVFLAKPGGTDPALVSVSDSNGRILVTYNK